MSPTTSAIQRNAALGRNTLPSPRPRTSSTSRPSSRRRPAGSRSLRASSATVLPMPSSGWSGCAGVSDGSGLMAPVSGVVIVVLPVLYFTAHRPGQTGLRQTVGSGALTADQIPVAFRGQLAAVMHEETTGTAELVGLHGQDLHGEFLVGQV